MDRKKINEYFRKYYQDNKGKTFYCEVCKTTYKNFSKYAHIRTLHHKMKYYELNLLNTKSTN